MHLAYVIKPDMAGITPFVFKAFITNVLNELLIVIYITHVG